MTSREGRKRANRSAIYREVLTVPRVKFICEIKEGSRLIVSGGRGVRKLNYKLSIGDIR